MKKIITILLLIVIAIHLCACQANPNQEAVISKNEGVFEANIHQSASEEKESPTEIADSEVFYSTDKSIEFSMNVEQTFTPSNLPVVEVEPYNLTGDDVKRIAQVFFGNAVFYECDQSSNPTYSKKQIQNNISRWSQYTNAESIIPLYYDPGTDPSYDIELLKMFIEQLNGIYETAPSENPDSICDWQLKKERHYNNLEMEIDGRSISDDADVIFAYTDVNGVEYVLAATTHNQDNYVSNSISIGLQSSFGLHWDTAIWRSELCRTEKPTESQLSTISIQAEKMISQMGVGNWIIKNVYINTDYYGEIPEYTIVVDAVPELNGVSAIWRQETQSMTSDDTVASNYPMSKIEIIFSPSGDLVYFEMVSPIVDKEVVNPNVAILSIDSLIETGKSHLMLSDSKAGYGLPEGAGIIEMYEEAFNERIVCKVEISGITLEMGRIRKANSDNSFYYIPVLVFEGTADYYGEKSGVLYFSSSDYYKPTINLVLVNAVDGSIIGR